jgi:diguanylate cyclase (GGDEF)-like protein/PAS domain S-box-containing protein
LTGSQVEPDFISQAEIMNNVVLVITAEAADASSLVQVLASARDGPFDIACVSTLAQGLTRLREDHIDIVLVDLFLPDSQGTATFDSLFRAAPDMPVMTLASYEDEPAAIEAVQRGAQGYLIKGHFHHGLVPQALRNIIHRRAVEAALFLEKERGRVILESIGEAVLSTDLAGNVIFLNAVAERMTGWSKERAHGRPFTEIAAIVDATTGEAVWDHLQAAIRENKPVRSAAGMLLVRRDSHRTAIEMSVAPVHERSGQLSGAVVVLHDASAAQAATFTKMTYLAQHDFLTDLPNRLLLNDRINHAITLAARHGTPVAVLFLDLDNFKHVNDSLGHAIGDQLLQSVAKRLTACIRTSDTVSRQGGDEFIIVTAHEQHAEGVEGVEGVSLAAEKVRAEIALSHHVSGHQLHVTTSIGISVYPQDGKDADTLVKHADAAMYHAKKRGRDNYQFFNGEMNQRAVERQAIEADLRHALERKQFVLHYQPKVNLKTGAITGSEALLRWRHPKRGLILPDHFVPIAEDCGLIGSIGHWVLHQACLQAKQWADAGLQAGSMAVNVSASEFRTQGFLEGVRTVLHDARIDAHKLELELTESVLMRNAESSRTMLRALKELGVKLVVDDFGTGYSSLSYLKQFPIDVLKIDQSFVRDVVPASDNGIIVTAVIGMGRNLRLRVVAEGVETRAQWKFLRSLQCDEGQGFYFSPPLEAQQFSRLLETGISRAAAN